MNDEEEVVQPPQILVRELTYQAMGCIYESVTNGGRWLRELDGSTPDPEGEYWLGAVIERRAKEIVATPNVPTLNELSWKLVDFWLWKRCERLLYLIELKYNDRFLIKERPPPPDELLARPTGIQMTLYNHGSEPGSPYVRMIPMY